MKILTTIVLLFYSCAPDLAPFYKKIKLIFMAFLLQPRSVDANECRFGIRI
jgi:hypothetical protein